MQKIKDSFLLLEKFIEKENYKGYDPYDTLLSPIPFRKFGKWIPIVAIQFQKRNPVNIRPLLGIKKGINPKAMGLFLQAYSILYRKTGNEKYRQKADYFFNWLKENYSSGYSGYCWGYNFPWASPVKYMDAYVPSAVVTGFVCKGLWEYYLLDKSPEAANLIISAGEFILKDLPQYSDDSGLSISYTPLMKDVCYNASLLAGEVLSMKYALTGDESLKQTCTDLVNFVVSRQKSSGLWNYSVDVNTGRERAQIDFHQGYIVESIYEISNRLKTVDIQWQNAIKAGLEFYISNQFCPDGRSLWRIPKEFPVEIHNQSQGIITFCKTGKFDEKFLPFARQIAGWTIDHMQSGNGSFFYHRNKFIHHKIPYMRWSQAWMFLALANLMD